MVIHKDGVRTIFAHFLNDIMRLEADDDADIWNVTEKFELPMDQRLAADIDEGLGLAEPEARADARTAQDN